MSDQKTATPQAEAPEALPIKLDVRVRPVEPKNNLMAFASVTINDSFIVHGLMVKNSKNGLFVDMPSVKDSKGEYRSTCYPVTADFRKQLHGAVLTGYAAAIDQMQAKVAAARESLAAEKPSIKDQLQAGQKKVKAQKAASAPQPARSADAR